MESERPPGLVTVLEDAAVAVDELGFQGGEEALGRGLIGSRPRLRRDAVRPGASGVRHDDRHRPS